MATRSFVFERWREVVRRYGFHEYDGPPLEELELYTKKSGAEIAEQLYCFQDKGDRDISLRAEMTPTLGRLITESARHYRKPIKWFSIPQLFRYEKAQVKKGRLREHFQLNVDIIGEPTLSGDAEMIAALIDCLRIFGLTSEDFKVRLSSRDAWSAFFREHGGSGDNEYAFFQAIDKLERLPREETEKRLSEVGVSMDSVEAFIAASKPTEDLQSIIDDLSNRGLADFIQIDYHIVRGLAYYTGVVYEVFDTEGTFRAIAGGGRYDTLIQRLSDEKVDLPALGFGMGDVVLTELLSKKGLLPSEDPSLDLFLIIEDESLRAPTLMLAQQARDAGFSVEYAFGAVRGDKQFKKALDLGARFTAKMEPESGDAITIRHLAAREETTSTREDWLAELAKQFRGV